MGQSPPLPYGSRHHWKSAPALTGKRMLAMVIFSSVGVRRGQMSWGQMSGDRVYILSRSLLGRLPCKGLVVVAGALRVAAAQLPAAWAGILGRIACIA